eukprot:1242097-Prymnesium_polylepis.1
MQVAFWTGTDQSRTASVAHTDSGWCDAPANTDANVMSSTARSKPSPLRFTRICVLWQQSEL